MDERAHEPRRRSPALTLAEGDGQRGLRRSRIAAAEVAVTERDRMNETLLAPARPPLQPTSQPTDEAAEDEARRARHKARRAKRKAARAALASPVPVPSEPNTTAPVSDAPANEAPPVAQPAAFAKRKLRHTALMIGFLVVVLGPTLVAAAYLYGRAVDRFASFSGFAVHSEDVGSGFEAFGPIGAALGVSGNASAKDTDFLYEFIQSQQIVADIDAQLDLRAIYSRHHDTDPYFSLAPDSTIEDLTSYWRQMVSVDYDAGTGLIKVRVLAPSAEEAHAISQAIFDRSSRAVNDLVAIAREDKMRFARTELDGAVEDLKEAREAISAFRSRTQIVDPTADLTGQMGLVNSLEAQLATALIDFDLLRETARESDPRIEQAERRIAVIERRIAEERGSMTTGGVAGTDEDYVAVLAEFERLSVEKEFAEQTYVAALASHDSSLAEAARQSRYLAAYLPPTLPQKSEHPRRAQLTAMTMFFALLTWAVGALVFYSIRDRR